MGAKTLALTLADFQWMSWYFFVVVYVSFFPVKIVHRNFRLFVLDITASPWLTLNFKIFEWFLRPFNAINKHERKNKLLLCIKWDCISIFHSGLLTYISTIMKFVRRYCRIRPFYFLKQRNHISEWVFFILRWGTDFNGWLWYHHFLYILWLLAPIIWLTFVIYLYSYREDGNETVKWKEISIHYWRYDKQLV